MLIEAVIVVLIIFAGLYVYKFLVERRNKRLFNKDTNKELTIICPHCGTAIGFYKEERDILLLPPCCEDFKECYTNCPNCKNKVILWRK